MQHFFIEGTGTLEGRPHLDLHVCLLLIFGITLWKSYELFDESDEMFLEVVENRFFPSRCLSFIDWRVAWCVLCLIYSGKIIGFLNNFWSGLPVEECLIVEELIYRVCFQAENIETVAVLFLKHFLGFGKEVVVGRHIFVNFEICMVKHYNSSHPN